MKIIGLTIAAAGVSALAYWGTDARHDHAAIDLKQDAAGHSAWAYKVLTTGRDHGCRLAVEDDVQSRRAAVRIDGDCQGGLGDVRYWADRPDGSVALLSEEGKQVVELGQADGAAYESYGAGAPITLISLD